MQTDSEIILFRVSNENKLVQEKKTNKYTEKC